VLVEDYRGHLASVDALLLSRLGVGEGMVGKVATHLVHSGGKRLRPLLCLVAAGIPAGGQAPADAISMAAAIEMLHLGSLYHDDVIDRSDVRRTGSSANAEYGNTLAVLGGDVLLAEAVLVSAEVGAPFAEVVARALRQLCDGQVLETEAENDVDRTEEQYMGSITGKTAALLVGACEAGALLASASPARTEALRSFALHYGLAFQIRDDILDIFSTPEALGKPPGTDLDDGILTLPMILAIEASPAAREVIGRWSRDDLHRVQQLVAETGALQRCMELVSLHADQAVAAVADADIEPPAREYLPVATQLLKTFPGMEGVSIGE